jgi:hypothetical protein
MCDLWRKDADSFISTFQTCESVREMVAECARFCAAGILRLLGVPEFIS